MPEFQISTAVSALIRISRPDVKRRHDLVAYALHAYFLCQGYKLVNVGTSPASAPPRDAPEVPMDGWNDNDELYVFTYIHSDKEFEPVVVKCANMGNLMVLCVASLTPEPTRPRTMNIKINETTTESIAEDITQRYTSLASLVDEFGKEIGEFRTKEEASKTPTQSTLLMDPRTHVPFGGRSEMMPAPVLAPVGGYRGEGGMHVGLDDPLFSSQIRHPELRHPRSGGMRYDPIGPPGMQGYHPDDFKTSNRGQPFHHPDIMPPGNNDDFDPDNMFF